MRGNSFLCVLALALMTQLTPAAQSQQEQQAINIPDQFQLEPVTPAEREKWTTILNELSGTFNRLLSFSVTAKGRQYLTDSSNVPTAQLYAVQAETGIQRTIQQKQEKSHDFSLDMFSINDKVTRLIINQQIMEQPAFLKPPGYNPIAASIGGPIAISTGKARTLQSFNWILESAPVETTSHAGLHVGRWYRKSGGLLFDGPFPTVLVPTAR